MVLYVVPSPAHELIRYALAHQPCLVLDAANKADPHAFYPEFMPEDMAGVSVVCVELLYALRQHVLALPAGRVVITPFTVLMNYQDREENDSVLRHTWELLREKGKTQDIIVGVAHEKLGRHYGTLVEDVWAIP